MAIKKLSDNKSKSNRGAKSGENRFKESQVKKVSQREKVLLKELEALDSNHVQFSKITYLARHLANVITKELNLKTPVAISTLIRNDVYMVHLLEYMLKQDESFYMSSSLEAIKIRLKQSNYVASLENKNSALQGKIEDLRDENKTLKQYIEKQNNSAGSNVGQTTEISYFEFNADVNKLCEVVDIMLKKSQNRYLLTEEGVKLMPRAMVIADNDLIRPYLSWRSERIVEEIE